MKFFLVFFALANFSYGYATDDRVKVTGFHYVFNNAGRLAEICGIVVKDLKPNSRVIIASDPGQDEGIYTALPDAQGRWCSVIVTNYGNANVTLVNEGTTNDTESNPTNHQVVRLRADRERGLHN